MKTLVIYPTRLSIRRAQIPANEELKMFKVSYEEAMAFKGNKVTFEELVSRYGVASQLKAGEFYTGYVISFYWWGHAEVVYLNGYLQKIDAKYANVVHDYKLAEQIRKGCAWECRYPTKEGSTNGQFDYIWTFQDCRFAEDIRYAQEHGGYFTGIDADAMDGMLKQKLINALTSKEQVITVTEDEDKVLRHYLGSNSYYRQFFVEVAA